METKKILVVEDDMIIQMFISRVISSLEFEVVGEARKCSEVLELVKSKAPDLILMDIGISGEKDGIDTAEIVNVDYPTPIIFITGNSDEATISRAKKANPVDFIFKPIDEDRLRNQILNFFNKQVKSFWTLYLLYFPFFDKSIYDTDQQTPF